MVTCWLCIFDQNQSRSVNISHCDEQTSECNWKTPLFPATVDGSQNCSCTEVSDGNSKQNKSQRSTAHRGTCSAMCLFDCPHSSDKMLGYCQRCGASVHCSKTDRTCGTNDFSEHLRNNIREHTCPQGADARLPTLMLGQSFRACDPVCGVEVCSFREGVERMVSEESRIHKTLLFRETLSLDGC